MAQEMRIVSGEELRKQVRVLMGLEQGTQVIVPERTMIKSIVGNCEIRSTQKMHSMCDRIMQQKVKPDGTVVSTVWDNVTFFK